MKESHKATAKNILLSILLSVFLSAAIALFILSVSIACPLLIRPVYYVQVEGLQLPAQTGLSREQIIEAYDDVMDYCTLGGERAGRTFRTGTLEWTEEGKDHFDDVERLFHLDFIVAIITAALLAVFLIARKTFRKKYRSGSCSASRFCTPLNNNHPEKPAGKRTSKYLRRSPLFWGPAVLLTVFTALTIAAMIDFDGFFTWFHHLFFPGKENWLLDPDTDEIIRILPYEVLQTFAIIIVGLILLGCIICLIADCRLSRHADPGIFSRQEDRDLLSARNNTPR